MLAEYFYLIIMGHLRF
ncbi:hypothetical protein MXB_5282 [Myxobolus squamalis]|nr:hypothetical protein MXB_5282 [Myxobolus squamalis]